MFFLVYVLKTGRSFRVQVAHSVMRQWRFCGGGTSLVRFGGPQGSKKFLVAVVFET